MRTFIRSSVGDHVLITLFQLYGTNAGLFEGNLFWVGQCDRFLTFILEEELIKY